MSVDEEPLLRIDGLSKEYALHQERSSLRAAIPGRWGEPVGEGTFSALDDVSFEVRPGEGVGIIGSNGAGKSTILKAVAGVIAPTSGSIETRGRVVSIIELGLGFDPDLTGGENIEYGGAFLGLSSAEVEARRDEIVAFAELESFTEMPVKRYSTGMLARLGFAVAMAAEADLYVVDEVLSVGDWGFQRKSLERMVEARRQGAALLFVSHNLWTVGQLCPRCLLIEHGKVAADGPSQRVLAQYLSDDVPGADPAPGGEEELAVAMEAGALATGTSLVAAPPRSSVRITGLTCTPSTIETGGSIVLTGRVEADHPLPDGRLVAGMFWLGFATFGAPEVVADGFIDRAGSWLFELDWSAIPIANSVLTFRVAVVRGDDPEDPEQLFPNAVTEASADLRVLGPVTAKPGLALRPTVRLKWTGGEVG